MDGSVEPWLRWDPIQRQWHQWRDLEPSWLILAWIPPTPKDSNQAQPLVTVGSLYRLGRKLGTNLSKVRVWHRFRKRIHDDPCVLAEAADPLEKSTMQSTRRTDKKWPWRLKSKVVPMQTWIMPWMIGELPYVNLYNTYVSSRFPVQAVMPVWLHWSCRVDATEVVIRCCSMKPNFWSTSKEDKVLHMSTTREVKAQSLPLPAKLPSFVHFHRILIATGGWEQGLEIC